jgi:transcriptional regulator with XRE-family HTH domain
MTLEQAAGQLGWSVTKMSRIETSRVGVSVKDLKRMFEVYELEDDRRAALLSLARGAKARGWWDAYSDSLPSDYASYIALESEASAMRWYACQAPPGLLHTREYAHEIIRAGLMALSPPAEVERRVDVRTTRQHLLTRDENPQRLWTVIDEAALRRQVGSPEVMRAQYDMLLEFADLPNVTLQILPDSAGAHPAMVGSFTIMEFPEPHDPDVVYVETFTGNLFIESDAEVYRYALAFDHLRAMALNPEDSRAFIAARKAGQHP